MIYMVKIGLEIHCQLNTKSKLFCSCSTNISEKEPNSETCPVCLGFPGYKPVVNKKAIDFTIGIGIALGCTISNETFFSRKTYFYPDMSKNFQITQYEIPIATGGSIDIEGNKIRIRRVHLEEDPAKIVYANGDISTTEYTLIDYNRSGIPLAEIVTEPDIETPKEARKLLEKISAILEYLNVYDVSKEASLRVDANISSEGERVEIKNITGFENVEKALSYEVIRQKSMTRMKKVIERETRHFDETTRTTKGLRKKEYEEDYGYIFDPDLPSIRIDDAWINSIKDNLPELPDNKVKRFVGEYKISDYDAGVIAYTGKDMADFFEDCCKIYKRYDNISKWIINYLLKSLNWNSQKVSESKVKPNTFIELLEIMDNGEITERYAKELIKEYVDSGISPRALAKKNEFKVTDAELKKTVEGILKENEKALEDLKAGKENAKQYIIGLVLKATNNQANPKLIIKIMEELIH